MDSERYVGRSIMTLANAIEKNRSQNLEHLGLTTSQADALRFFLDNPGSSIKDLKEHLGVVHQTAQGIITRMVSKGWLSMQRSETDKRFQLIHLTESGHILCQKIGENRGRTVTTLLDGMSDEEVETFKRMLHTAYENLRRAGIG